MNYEAQNDQGNNARIVNQGTFLWIGFLTGFLLNLTGWLGNNFLLGDMWSEVGATLSKSAWRASIWRDIFSFIPDYVYGYSITFLILVFRPRSSSALNSSLKAGLLVSILGGITTYFAIANSGFIPWKLGLFSFVLVLITKMSLAILAGHILERSYK